MNTKACLLCVTLVCVVYVACQVCRAPGKLLPQKSLYSSPGSSSNDNSFSAAAGQTTSNTPAHSRRSGAGGHAARSERAEALISWVEQHGGVVDVDVVYAGPSRGHVVLSRHEMSRGDVLAAIPVDLCWVLEQHGARGSVLLAAVNLVTEMADPTSPWAPFFNTLPPPNDLSCPLVSLPAQYIPLLQHAALEAFVTSYQDRIKRFHKELVQPNAPHITLPQLQYGQSLLVTRMFATAEFGNTLVPLMHYANHVPDCQTSFTVEPCPTDAARRCMVWVMGSHLAPGAEVCIGYKYMTNDKALLQYGFLQDGPLSSHLHLLDHAAFNGTNFWSLYEHSKQGPPLFDGTLQQLQAEAERLTATLAAVTSGDANASVTLPVSSDPSGRMLSMVLAWRQQRKAALQAEVERLRRRIAAAAASAATAGEGGGGGADVAAVVSSSAGEGERGGAGTLDASRELTAWVEEAGGAVCA